MIRSRCVFCIYADSAVVIGEGFLWREGGEGAVTNKFKMSAVHSRRRSPYRPRYRPRYRRAPLSPQRSRPRYQFQRHNNNYRRRRSRSRSRSRSRTRTRSPVRSRTRSRTRSPVRTNARVRRVTVPCTPTVEERFVLLLDGQVHPEHYCTSREALHQLRQWHDEVFAELVLDDQALPWLVRTQCGNIRLLSSSTRVQNSHSVVMRQAKVHGPDSPPETPEELQSKVDDLCDYEEEPEEPEEPQEAQEPPRICREVVASKGGQKVEVTVSVLMNESEKTQLRQSWTELQERLQKKTEAYLPDSRSVALVRVSRKIT